MAWIRLDDDYIYHPKFVLLSDRAFRLWHEGASYCRKLMTDGLITRSDLRAFKYASAKTIQELTTPRGQSSPLWVEDPAGYRVHDYLDWNPSQADEQRDREATKLRMRAYRGRAKPPPVTPPVTPFVTLNVTPTVPGQGQGSDLRSEHAAEKFVPASDALLDRARQFIERYPAIYAQERDGALYPVKESRDFETFLTLVRVWTDDTHLDGMFRVFLHLKGRDVLNQPGTPNQFLHHAPECDSLMRKNGR